MFERYFSWHSLRKERYSQENKGKYRTLMELWYPSYDSAWEIAKSKLNGAGKKPLLPLPQRSKLWVLHTITSFIALVIAHLLTRHQWNYKIKEIQPFQEAYHTIVFKRLLKSKWTSSWWMVKFISIVLRRFEVKTMVGERFLQEDAFWGI